MAKSYIRTRSKRRVQVRFPGNTTATRYRRRRPAAAKCAGCKKVLQAIPRKLPGIVKNLPKSALRPSRPYGGYFCSACMRNAVIAKVRASQEVSAGDES
ncbi:MAG: 50S ribosomal protein L34e [Nanoarchaeota archaeon]|nr:50S ribosomal protein L34e [Nanoarchaeota archaeon]